MEKLKNEIMHAFERSGKRHIVITGSKGSGKTTLASLICKSPKSGFKTKATPFERVVMENIATGESAEVGVYDCSICKMRANSIEFEGLGIEAVNAAARDAEISLFDEIGYLETDIRGFTEAFEKMLDEKSSVICVRREKTPFIERIFNREDVFAVDLDTLKSDVTLVIMASGLSRRFGENKLLYEVNGKRLAEHILISSAGIFKRRVVVTRTPELKEICEAYGVECVLHSLPNRSDTIRLGLDFAGESKGVMFCPADQPFVERRSLIRLVNTFSDNNEKICRLSFGSVSGLPVIFPERYFSELSSLEAGGGREIIKKNMAEVVGVEALFEKELFDIDTKEDILRLI